MSITEGRTSLSKRAKAAMQLADRFLEEADHIPLNKISLRYAKEEKLGVASGHKWSNAVCQDCRGVGSYLHVNLDVQTGEQTHHERPCPACSPQAAMKQTLREIREKVSRDLTNWLEHLLLNDSDVGFTSKLEPSDDTYDEVRARILTKMAKVADGLD